MSTESKRSPTLYEDFEIEVSPCQHGELEVRVLRSPFDRPRARFVPPYRPEEIAELLANLEDRVCRSSASLRDLVGEKPEGTEPTGEDPKQVGRKLFEALFKDGVQGTLASCGYVLYGDQKASRGLRLRLGFGTAETYRADLAALPWEFLYHPRQRGFLALDPQTPVVRYLDTPRPTWALRVKPPLRILGVMPSPAGVGPALYLDQEWRHLEKALEGTMVELDVLEPPATLERLCARLRGGGLPYHVVHFMGHGDFQDGEGVLLFEDDAGRKDPVSGEVLATQLGEGLNFLRLMVINACKGAKMNRHRGQDPYTSVAAELTMAGLPAVVAMQFPISDDAATWFSTAFYDALAEGRPVDSAVVEGRLAIHRNSRTSLEWATPVLFLQVPDGRILDVSDDEPSGPLRVGIMSFVGWGKEIAELGKNSDYFLNLTDAFEGRAVRDPSLWQEDIGLRLERFMMRAVKEGHPHRLEIPAHASIAFAAGYHLEAKGGLDLAIRQRGIRRTEDWRIDEGRVPEEPLWKLESRELDGEKDRALAIAISRRVPGDVHTYLEQQDLPLRKLLVATPADGTALDGVLSGAHAFRMAQALANWIDDKGRQGTLHLFVSGPNAFVFYLGQLARNFGTVQLYEHDFGGTGTYTPSIRLGDEGDAK